MPDLADKFNAFRRRRNQTVQALEDQVAELKQRLVISEGLVLQLRNDLDTLNTSTRPDTPPTNPHTSERIRLREEILDVTARADQLHQRYSYLCHELAGRSAQVDDLKICIAEMKEQAAAQTTTLEEISEESQARASKIEKAQQRLSLAEQRTLELRTQLRMAKQEGESMGNRIRQMDERLSFASQRALDLRTQLRIAKQESEAKSLKIKELERDFKEDRQRFKLNLRALKQEKDTEIAIVRQSVSEEKRKRISLEEKIKCNENRIKDLEERLGKQQGSFVGKLRQLFVNTMNGKPVTYRDVSIDTTVAAFKEMVGVDTLVSTCTQQLIYEGRVLLKDGKSVFRVIVFIALVDELIGVPILLGCTLGDYGIVNNATIYMVPRLIGGKPVITLYPPSRQRTTITLGLCTGSKFIYLHPKPTNGAPPSKVKTLREIEWEVEVDPNGGITTIDATRQRVSYLFWEAFFSQCREIDVSVSRHQPGTIFVMSIDDLPTFLDDFMERCGFPVKEKQDMVTYWAPQLSNFEYVAIRFLKPEEYHILAPLTVSPPPDRLVRLFALFKGVGERAALEWQRIVLADVEEQVGVLLRGKARPTVGAGEFCAFEWGGMIV